MKAWHKELLRACSRVDRQGNTPEEHDQALAELHVQLTPTTIRALVMAADRGHRFDLIKKALDISKTFVTED